MIQIYKYFNYLGFVPLKITYQKEDKKCRINRFSITFPNLFLLLLFYIFLSF